MQSRGLAEHEIDKKIKGAKQVFNLLRNKLSDENCLTIITSLCEASSEAPEYKRDEIIPLLMNAYYQRVMLNKKFPETALEAARQFQALGELEDDHSFYSYYTKFSAEIINLVPDLEKEVRDGWYLTMEKNIESNLQLALAAGKKFMEYCPQKEKTDKRFTEVTHAMLVINRKLVSVREEARKAMARSEARKSSIFETPAIRMYHSDHYPRPPVPRTPKPVTRSLYDKKIHGVSKSHTGVSSVKKPGKK